MNAIIISIGTELTTGRSTDTNAAWLAAKLAAIGITCDRHVTVKDDRAAATATLTEASATADLVLVTGGLGPTPDDLTRHALADALGTELALHQPSLDAIADFFRQRKRTMTESNRVQAMFPTSATAIENTCGTAPGIHATLNKADVYILPGVPREMKTMFERDVLPGITGAAGDTVLVQHTLKTFSAPESRLGEQLADLMTPGRNPAIGTSAQDWVIAIHIDAQADSRDEALRLIDADAADIRRRLGDAVFGEGDDTLAHAVAHLLISQHKTVATAESCTGGLIAKRLTDVSGSSTYFIQGHVTYANEAKHRLLNVPMELIEVHGAVSRHVAETMAANCRELAGADYALATTGIAGPTGGTPEKPVGLVFIALATPTEMIVKELHIGESTPRNAIRDRASKSALNQLRLQLIGRH